MQCNADREPPVRPALPAKSDSLAGSGSGVPRVKREDGGGSGVVQHPLSSKRTVCDHCRRRRIRCDGQFPCQQCANATLTCKREHVPKKRGPKRGHGRVINELRAREKAPRDPDSASNSDAENDGSFSPSRSAAPTASLSPRESFVPRLRTSVSSSSASDHRYAAEPQSPFSSDAFRPNSRCYFHLIPRCVDLYYEHMYPIMPLLYMPNLRATVARPLTPSDKNLVYALCALTSFHMSGKSTSPPGPPSWEMVGRFFLDECISVRQSYDFVEDLSLSSVISSFWLSTSFFEINQNRKSWYYLREAMTLALDLGLHDDATYVDMTSEEVLCRQRVFWILFVTERSFAILRNKPLTLRKTPRLPTRGHDYEGPDIHSGFMKLVNSYIPLDESFVNAWNDGSDPRVSAATYLSLQRIFAQPLDFLSRLRRKNHPTGLLSSYKNEDEEVEISEPTAIQKADLLMTQQWLRLIIWLSAFRQGLLSTASPEESMNFSFPLSIARDTAAALQSLPSSAIEVHGMGIFEKIFEIGTWCVNVLGAYDAGSSSSRGPYGRATNNTAGMDLVRGDLGLLGQGGRLGAHTDPLEFFVKTLSLSPNSRKMFAEKLLMFAGDTPGGLRTSLSPAPSTLTTSSSGTEGSRRGDGVLVEEASDDVNAYEVVSPSPVRANHWQTIGGDAMEGVIAGTIYGNTHHDSGAGMGTGFTARGSGVHRIVPDIPFLAGLSPMSATGANWTGYEFGSIHSQAHTGYMRARLGPIPAPLGAFMGGTGVPPAGYTDGQGANGQYGQSKRFSSSNGILGVW
ncbi:Uu.00g062510.m01.CDS01 [Anthostomella pinea]|uniref:Uu.00g062510.m01.CDS01 n=1 Tax=Anthostomella pinea TaxID=933095 RepID=A0AAI8YN14_9PEZI|nr:Uu.00g062510.m01.CDS01 [Anthostomella pinea]